MKMFLPINKRGFTLIEMLVSLSVFTVVITIAVGAFVSLIGASKGVESEQSVMTTLTFVLDSMTREIRTGKSYYCNTRAVLAGTPMDTSTVRRCENGSQGLSFIEAGSSITAGRTSRRVAYYFDSTTGTGTIMRKVANGTPQSIVSSGITINNAQFFVTGVDRLSTANIDSNQPTVTIVIEATDDTGAITTLQTTVTQRELDI